MDLLRLAPYILGGGAAALAAGAYLWVRLRRKNPERLEMERRLRINQIGRITDGTLLDASETGAEANPTHLLIYQYDVSGVTYHASQDVTHIRDLVGKSQRLGGAVSVKYDAQNPGNSIVVCEKWSGLRK